MLTVLMVLYGNMVPSRTGKPGKTGEHFPVREKSGNFAKTGKSQRILLEMLEKLGILDN